MTFGLPTNPASNTDLVKQLGQNLGGNIQTSAHAMAQHPLTTSAGLVTGLGKGVSDIPAMLVAGGVGAWNAVTGQKNEVPMMKNLESYDKSWRDNTIKGLNAITGKEENFNLDNAEVQKAVGGGQAVTSMIGPAGIPSKGTKWLKGGAAGITSEAAIKTNLLADQALGHVGNAVAPLVDPLLVGASKLPGLKATKAGKNAASAGMSGNVAAIANTLNPKSTTNAIKASAPELLPQLSEKYGVPIARIDDLGETLHSKFQQYQDDLAGKKLANKGIKKTPLVEAQAKKESESSFKAAFETKESPSIDSFINNELKGMDIPPTTKVLLKDSFKASILERQKYHNLASAEEFYNLKITQAKKSTEISKELETLRAKPQELKTEGELIRENQLADNLADGSDRQSIVNAAQRLRTNHENNYFKELMTNDTAKVEKAHLTRLDADKKIIKELSEIDPKLAVEYDQKATDSLVSGFGKLSNMFKMEPALGDFSQVAESLPSALRNNAEMLGVDYDEAVKWSHGSGDWVGKNQDLLTNTIFNKYKNSITALKESEGATRNTVTSLSHKFNQAFDNAGYAFQNQTRERMIENVFVPKAYGQVKAWGKFTEGSKEFNNAVINHTQKIIEDVGMAPPKSSYVVKTGETSYKVSKHIDEAIKDGLRRSSLPTQFKKELVSSALFMTTWVKGVVQAKLQAYNGIIESLRDIGVSGAVTKAQRGRIVSGLASIAWTTTVFGVRGARVPGLFQEISSPTSNPNAPAETVATQAVDMVQKMIGGMTNEERLAVRDGLWGIHTGLTGARTVNVPIIGAGTGQNIATSMIWKKISNLADSMLSATDSIRRGEFGEAGTELMEIPLSIIPKDIDLVTDAQIKGETYDLAGNPIKMTGALGENAVGQQLGAISKNLPLENTVENTSFMGKELTGLDAKIKSKYSQYNIKEFVKGGHLKSAFKEFKTLYPEDKALAVDKLSKMIDSKLAPTSTKVFKELKSNFKDLNALDKNVIIQEYPKLGRITRKEAVELAAESIAMDNNLEIFQLVKKVGKISKLTKEEKAYILTKSQEIKNEKLALFGPENTESE